MAARLELLLARGECPLAVVGRRASVREHAVALAERVLLLLQLPLARGECRLPLVRRRRARVELRRARIAVELALPMLDARLPRVELGGTRIELADAGRGLLVDLLVPAPEAGAGWRVAELPLADVELPLARRDRGGTLRELVRARVRHRRTLVVLAARSVVAAPVLELALTLSQLPLVRADRRRTLRELARLHVDRLLVVLAPPREALPRRVAALARVELVLANGQLALAHRDELRALAQRLLQLLDLGTGLGTLRLPPLGELPREPQQLLAVDFRERVLAAPRVEALLPAVGH